MSRKKEKKPKARPEERNPLPPPANEPAKVEAAEDQTDYGGLPDRDLKKNLGCG